MKSTIKNLFVTGILPIAFSFSADAQKKAEVQVSPQIKLESVAKICTTLLPGKILNNPKLEYPLAAKNALIGGTIEVGIKIDEKGNVREVENVAGNPVLQGAAVKSALQAKFTPTVCDNVPTQISGVIFYNFVPSANLDAYFPPAKIEDFADVAKDSPYYEVLIDLIENDKIAFGYADKNFHAETPLSRGDFAHFLRQTLDMISERAKISGKLPREINLFHPRNPQAIKSADKITDVNAKQPYAESVKTLLLKYDINLANEEGKFQGSQPLAQNEMMDLWTAIFGEDVVPVNFKKSVYPPRLMTRGEFALFLQESLRVLTYKVLP